jgi:hypothetical protein
MAHEDRSAPKFHVGEHVEAPSQRIRGTVEKVEWSTTFGQPTYLIVGKAVEYPEWGARTHGRVFVAESDLRKTVRRGGKTSAKKHESGKNPKIESGSGAWTVYWEVHRPLGEPEFHHHRYPTKKGAEALARRLSIEDSGRYFSVMHRGLEVSEFYKGTSPREAGWQGGYRPEPRRMGPEPRASYLPSGSKHESGRNPLTLGERAKMRLGVLSPAAARSANSREKDLLREHSSEVQKLIESVDACRKCDHSAEKKAKKHIQKAKDILAGLEKLAKYRSDADVAEASMKPLRKRVFEAEARLAGRNPGAIAKREHSSSSSGNGGGRGSHGRRPKDYTEAEFHEAEGNPRVSRSHPRRREVTVFKAHSPSRATMVAAKLRKAGHDSAVIGGYGGRTVVVDTPAGRRAGGKTLRESDAVLRAKIRALVGKK